MYGSIWLFEMCLVYISGKYGTKYDQWNIKKYLFLSTELWIPVEFTVTLTNISFSAERQIKKLKNTGRNGSSYGSRIGGVQCQWDGDDKLVDTTPQDNNYFSGYKKLLLKDDSSLRQQHYVLQQQGWCPKNNITAHCENCEKNIHPESWNFGGHYLKFTTLARAKKPLVCGRKGQNCCSKFFSSASLTSVTPLPQPH